MEQSRLEKIKEAAYMAMVDFAKSDRAVPNASEIDAVLKRMDVTGCKGLAKNMKLERSVDEELPEDGALVLVAIDPKFYSHSYDIGRYDGKGWWDCHGIGSFRDSVTHWRKLPSLPDTNLVMR